MKKFSKIGKRVLAFFLVALMNINTYAAVGGNDGSAFVTKAEFDALVNTFNEQMDAYESGLNTKIDGAIANYLSALSSKKHVEIVTGIDIETNGGAKTLRFVKSTVKHLNMDQIPRGNDTIYTSAIGTYRKLAAYEQDTYDTLIYTSTNSYGSNNNLLCLIDDENVANTFRYNVRADVNRNLVFYSTTHAQNGLSWTTVKTVYGLPGALFSDSSVYQSSLTATGRAFRRGTGGSVFVNTANGKVIAQNDCDPTTGDTTEYNILGTQQTMYYTANNHNQDISYTLRNTIVNFTGTEQTGYVDHWSQGSSYKLKTTDKEWDNINILADAYSTATNYTVNIRCRYQSGPGAYNTIWPTVTTQGMGIKFNTTDKDVNEIYYRNIKDTWDKKISYAGGFPLYYSDTEDEATITIPLQLSTQATVTIMNTQRTAFPADGSDDIIPFSYRPVGGNWVNVGQKSVLLGGSEFEFKFNMSKGQIAYLDAKWETADNTLLITQTGKAYLETDE